MRGHNAWQSQIKQLSPANNRNRKPNMLLIPIAILAAVMTYLVTSYVLRTFGTFDSPRLIALCIALLSGFSLLSFGQGFVVLILLPYAALGLTILPLLLLKWLIGSTSRFDLKRFLRD